MVLSVPPNLTPAQLLDLFNQLKIDLSNLQAGRYALVAGTTLGLYDHFLTLDRERRYIWRAKTWSMPRAIFLFTRYSFPLIMIGNIVDNLGPPRSDALCLGWTVLNTFWTFIMYSMMHWLVALRVYAYWGRERRVLISFVILWSIAFAATTTEATIWMVNYKDTAAYDPLLKSCVISAPSWLPVINIGFLLLEIPAVCLTAWKFRKDSKTLNHSLLIKTLIRDGILYFFVVLALTTGTALFTYFAPLTMSGVPRFLTLGIAVTVSRLVLSLRVVGERETRPSGEVVGETTVTGYVPYKVGPSRDVVSGAGHLRGDSKAGANSYPLDMFGSGRRVPLVQPSLAQSWPPDQTIVIGNPYAFMDAPEVTRV